MLFDLTGRRKRAVQVIYLFLALLMGGGLVFFGIGGDVSGGLADIFTSDDGGDGNEEIEKRIDSQEARLAQDPNNAAALAALTRLHYQLASAQIPSGATQFPEESKDDLRRAGTFWERYVDAVDQPDASLTSLAVQLYSAQGLNQPDKAKQAALILARDTNDTESYLNVFVLATEAGDTRTADLSAQKAIDLAPEDQRKQVREQIEAFKKAQQEAQQPEGEK